MLQGRPEAALGRTLAGVMSEQLRESQMHIDRNMGAADRSIRGGLAVACGALGLRTSRTGVRIVLLSLAGLLGGTAATGHCPVYAFADVDTLPYRTPVLKMGSCGGANGCEGCTCAA
jgi:hypothetical protein